MQRLRLTDYLNHLKRGNFHAYHWRQFELNKECVILVTTVGRYSLSMGEERYLTSLYAAITRNGDGPCGSW